MDDFTQNLFDFINGGKNKREREERLKFAKEYVKSKASAEETTTSQNLPQRQADADFQFSNDARATAAELDRYGSYNDLNRENFEKTSPLVLDHLQGKTDIYTDGVGKVTAPAYDILNRQIDSRDGNLEKLIDANNMNMKRQNTMDMLRTGGAILLNFL
tara:strand:- start:1943 stop:2419 length:477 start_codon:yes stop_codon:yes gene_type:complete